MTPMILMVTTGAALAGGMIIMVAVQIHYLRHTRALTQEVLASLEKVQALGKASATAVVSLNSAQQAMEERLTHVLRQQQAREARDARSLTYNQANRLIRMGADPDDLVRSCGLSQAEA